MQRTFLFAAECFAWTARGETVDMILRIICDPSPAHWDCEIIHADILDVDLCVIRCVQSQELPALLADFKSWLLTEEAEFFRDAVEGRGWEEAMQRLPAGPVMMTEEDVFSLN